MSDPYAELTAFMYELAVCRYRLRWTGIVDGDPSSGQGRGTNVGTKRDGVWRMSHEHLSR